MIKKHKYTFVLLIPLLIFSGLFFYYKFYLHTVETAKPRIGSVIDFTSGNVTAKAELDIQLQSTGSGIVSYVLQVPTGESHLKVLKGDIILELDQDEFERNKNTILNSISLLEKQKNNRSKNEVELETLNSNLPLQELFFSEGKISLFQLEQAKRKKRDLESQINLEAHSLAIRLDNLYKNLQDLESKKCLPIRAPDDGFVIGKLNTAIGQHINFGANICRFISKDLYFLISINQEEMNGVKVGQEVRMDFDSFNSNSVFAEVTSIQPIVSSSSKKQSVIAKISTNSSINNLFCGMTGEALIIKNKYDKVMIIPKKAVFDNKVYIVKNSRVQIIPILTGCQGITEVEVKNGIKANDRVIVDNISSIIPGSKVRTKKGTS